MSHLRTPDGDEETLRAIVADPHPTGLDRADVAAMDFVDRIAADPTVATEVDVRALGDAGLSERDFRVMLAVAARRFFAGVPDAVGASPDPVHDSLAGTVPS
jgi:uncharacterized protein YciW